MMNINSRMVSRYIADDNTESNELSTDPRFGRRVFFPSHGGISVTREERTDSAHHSLVDCKYYQYYNKPCGDKGLTFTGKYHFVVTPMSRK